MNAVLYPEPYRVPAGVLALLVHGAFFSLLYFGFTWQAIEPETMSVELWRDLPSHTETVSPPPAPKVEEEAPPPQQVKPEIAVPDKKKVAPKPVPVKPDTRIEDAAARERAAQAAAQGKVVDEYVAKIMTRIRSRIVMPPDVPDDARAEFAVTVLPGGSVLNPRLLKTSGNSAYDSAVERAILKAQPLPLPADTALFNRFREMKLGFRPKE
ncbi:MAG: TonB C-terminal domain-containing protein [Gallionella sp.]|nr:TonB C-terminal domain-containing protein [Gallionella sp.]